MAAASPLSPAHDSVLNASTPPPSSLRYDMYEVKAFTATHSVSGSSTDTISTETTTDATVATADSADGGDRADSADGGDRADSADNGGDGGDGDGEIVSSPCENAVPLAVVTAVEEGQENGSPTKRHSRILSGPELSPLKLARTVSNGSASSASASAATAATAAAAAATVSVLTAVPAFASERPDPGTVRSPRRPLAMERRFPVRVHSPSMGRSATPPPRPAPAEEQNPAGARHMSLDETLKHNTGLAKAIEIFEDEDNDDPENEDYYGREGAGDGSDSGSGSGSVIVRSRWSSAADQGGEDVTAKILVNLEPEPAAAGAGADDYDYDEPNPADDTMMSTLSTFSAVPNLTMLSKFGNSPAKAAAAHLHHLGAGGGTTPRGRPDPSPSRGRPRPYSMMQDSTATASLLMDFTDSMRFPPSQSPAAVSPSRGRNGYNAYGTPGRNSGAAGNLIDFEIPPLPTPRSIPSVTPRELESLKSNFLSEISSLKASLSGKEAEVASLKTAVGDAEKRVGECMEQVREERAEREQLAAEKQDWERRGAEMEGVLRKMRDEMMATRREREELEAKLDESEKRREAAEMMAQEAESKMAGLRAGRAAEERERSLTAAPSPSSATAREVEQAVERVARELHALYKSKHETKVAALKKSYESRWEKRVRELEARLNEAAEENERIRAGHSSPALHRLDLIDHAAEEERRRQAAGDAARIRELAAEVEKLEAVTRSVRGDNDGLRHLLERERVEKGELVQLAEEMMAMQSFVAAAPPQSQSQSQFQPQSQSQFQPQPQSQSQPPATPRSVASVAPSPRKSMPPPPSSARTPRPAPVSGLRAPAESRIGKGASAAAHERTQSGGGAARGGGGGVGGGMGGGLSGALPRPGGAGLGGMRSGIMSSIEKMGNHRGRGGE